MGTGITNSPLDEAGNLISITVLTTFRVSTGCSSAKRWGSSAVSRSTLQRTTSGARRREKITVNRRIHRSPESAGGSAGWPQPPISATLTRGTLTSREPPGAERDSLGLPRQATRGSNGYRRWPPWWPRRAPRRPSPSRARVLAGEPRPVEERTARGRRRPALSEPHRHLSGSVRRSASRVNGRYSRASRRTAMPAPRWRRSTREQRIGRTL